MPSDRETIEDRYQRIIAAVSDYLYSVRLVDYRPVETLHGAGCVSVTGYTSQEFAADPYLWFRMVAEPDRPAVQDYAQRILDGEDPGPLEHRIIRKDGTLRWIRNTPVVQRDEQGRLVCYDGIIQDITEHKFDETRIKESEEHYRTLFENASEGIYRTTLDGRLLLANPALASMFGYSSPEEILGRVTNIGFQTFTDPEERNRMIQRLLTGEPITGYEVSLKLADGTPIWVVLNCYLKRDAAGVPRYIEGTCVDISARRAAEERMLGAIKRLEDIIEFLPDPTSIIDRQGIVIAWNKAMEEMTGVPKSEHVGKHHHLSTIPFYGYVSPNLVDLLDKDDEELAASYPHIKRKGSALYTEGLVPALYNGRGAYVMALAARLFDRQGAIVGAIETIRDISEAKQAEVALKASEEKYRLVVENAREGIFVAQKGMFKFTNPFLAEILGYSPEELRTIPFMPFIYPDDSDAVVERHRRRLRGETVPEVYSFRIIHRSGLIRWVEIHAILIEWDGLPATLNFIADITERRQAEEALRASEELHRLLTENAQDMISCHTPDGTVVYVSPACRRMLGYDPAEMIGRSESLIVHPDDHAEVWNIINRHLREGADTYLLQHRTLRKDGSWLWVETAGRFIRNADGALKEIQCNVRDISERKRSEEALRASEELHRILTENAHDMITRHAPDGSVLYVSPACRRILGYEPEELIDRKIVPLIPPEDLKASWETVDRRLREGAETFTTKFRMRRKDGAWLWCESVGRFIRAEDGSVKEMHCAMRDISDRMRSEENLRISEEKFRSIVESSPTAMHLYRHENNGDLILIGANPAADRTLGFKHAPLIGKRMEAAFPEMIGTPLPGLCAKVASEQLGMQVFENVFQNGATTRVYDVSMFSTGPNMMTVAFTDITARKQAQAELEELDRELKRKNQELESIVYATSHDLRSPLLNIQGFGKRLEAACGDFVKIITAPEAPPEIRAAAAPLVEDIIPKSLRFIGSSVEKMDSLIKGLLQLSRLGRAILNLQIVDLRNLIQQVTEAIGFQIQEAEATIEIGDLPPCRCDATQMSQVFSNLIDNALKYRSPDRTPHIRIYHELIGHDRVYVIEDNGIGIPPEHRDKVWELFHRLEPSSRVSGEGLGLTVVRRIIERHGGRIWVESGHENGTRFCFLMKNTGAP